MECFLRRWRKSVGVTDSRSRQVGSPPGRPTRPGGLWAWVGSLSVGFLVPGVEGPWMIRLCLGVVGLFLHMARVDFVNVCTLPFCPLVYPKIVLVPPAYKSSPTLVVMVSLKPYFYVGVLHLSNHCKELTV